jgi:hypothetical protein
LIEDVSGAARKRGLDRTTERVNASPAGAILATAKAPWRRSLAPWQPGAERGLARSPVSALIGK